VVVGVDGDGTETVVGIVVIELWVAERGDFRG
jgi:hypothetical protein